MAAVTRSRFYPLFALALALVVFTGFARTLYLRQWFDVPPLTVLSYLHGIVFSMWVALYVVQTRLIAAHQVRAHMRLGIVGVALAMLVVAIGLATVFVSASAARPRAMGMTSAQFVFVPFFILVVFSCLVTAAVSLREHPALHKRLMTLAMVAILPPATARLITLAGGQQHFLELQTALTVVFVAVCLAGDWIKHRILHPVYAIGGVLLVLSWPFRVWVARTDAWGHVGSWMAQVGKQFGG
jgi:hypothetical protein